MNNDEVDADDFVENVIATPVFGFIEKFETYLFQLFDSSNKISVNQNLLNKFNFRLNSIEYVNMNYCETKLQSIDDLSTIICSNLELGILPAELGKCSKCLFYSFYFYFLL